MWLFLTPWHFFTKDNFFFTVPCANVEFGCTTEIRKICSFALRQKSLFMVDSAGFKCNCGVQDFAFASLQACSSEVHLMQKNFVLGVFTALCALYIFWWLLAAFNLARNLQFASATAPAWHPTSATLSLVIVLARTDSTDQHVPSAPEDTTIILCVSDAPAATLAQRMR